MRKLIVLVLLTAVSLFFIWLFSTTSPRRKYYSPDKTFSIYTAPYNYEVLLPKAPGDASGSTGKVFLYDELKQKIIASAPISYVGAGAEIQWGRQEAYFIGDEMPHFNLPRPIKSEEVSH